MKRIGVRCWKDQERCESGDVVNVYFTVSDYGDAVKLFICLTCGAIFGIHPDTEYYSGVSFEELRKDLTCPVCHRPLKDVVPYPDTFLCPDLKHTGSYLRPDRTIPAAESSVTMEFWNPYDW